MVLAVAVMAGCQRSDGGAGRVIAADSADVARAREAANALGGELMTMLLTALDEWGPEAAVTFCADSAQYRSARHQAQGRSVRRVGTRLRNPLNGPDSTEAGLLAAFQEALHRGEAPGDTAFVLRDTIHYARPILVAEGCLACHGPRESLAPGVLAILAERYPDDAATGYAVGDLRGAISVRLPRASTAGNR
jgi:hypothetical protein